MRCGGHMYRTTVAAAAIAGSAGVTGYRQPSVPTAFASGFDTFVARRRSLVLPGTSSTKQQQLSPVNTADKRNSRHSSSRHSSSSSSLLRMTSHGNNKYTIRTCRGGEDYEKIIGSVDGWWGGRRMTPMLPRLFFEHFSSTSFVAETWETAVGETLPEAKIVGFVCGFVSPSRPSEGYVHFVGVDPARREVGLGSALYERFFDEMRTRGCLSVRAVTSPANTASIAFHERLGFEAVRVAAAASTSTRITNSDTGDDADEKETALEGVADGSSSSVADEYVHVGWDGPDGGDRVLLQKEII